MASKFTIVKTRNDCAPAPAEFAPILQQIADEIGCDYNSLYRGPGADAELAHCGKHSQAWIYAHYPRGVANPPGKSTHELRNDGVAYAGPVGAQLEWWQCGIDVNDAYVQAFIRQAAKHGWIATITYPGSRVEYHHVNFRQAPYYYPVLKEGSFGPRVLYYSRWLARLKFHLSHGRFHFDHSMTVAVERFQTAYHQKPDGIIGPQTREQIKLAIRYYKKHGTRPPVAA